MKSAHLVIDVNAFWRFKVAIIIIILRLSLCTSGYSILVYMSFCNTTYKRAIKQTGTLYNITCLYTLQHVFDRCACRNLKRLYIMFSEIWLYFPRFDITFMKSVMLLSQLCKPTYTRYMYNNHIPDLRLSKAADCCMLKLIHIIQLHDIWHYSSMHMLVCSHAYNWIKGTTLVE